LIFVDLEVAVEIVAPAVALLAEPTGKGPHALVELVDMAPEAVQLGEGFPADGAVVLDPSADFAAQRLRRRHGGAETEEGKSGNRLARLLNDLQ
jgi:hypothetical protein